MCLVQKFVYFVVVAMVLLGRFKSTNSLLELVSVQLVLCLIEEAVEGCWIVLEGFLAVWRCFALAPLDIVSRLFTIPD